MSVTTVLRPKALATIAYLILTLAGCSFAFWLPTTSLRVFLGELGFYVWNGFMIGGSLIAAFGVWKRQNLIELIGLPLLIAALCAYAVQLFARFPESQAPGALVGLSLVFFYTSAELVIRIVTILKYHIISRRFHRRAGDGK